MWNNCLLSTTCHLTEMYTSISSDDTLLITRHSLEKCPNSPGLWLFSRCSPFSACQNHNYTLLPSWLEPYFGIPFSLLPKLRRDKTCLADRNTLQACRSNRNQERQKTMPKKTARPAGTRSKNQSAWSADTASAKIASYRGLTAPPQQTTALSAREFFSSTHL